MVTSSKIPPQLTPQPMDLVNHTLDSTLDSPTIDSNANLDPAPERFPYLDLEIDRLRGHLRASQHDQADSPTLQSAAVILRSISLSLLDLTRLLRTYQLLQSSGEPVISHLERALTDIARELKEMEEHQAAAS